MADGFVLQEKLVWFAMSFMSKGAAAQWADRIAASAAAFQALKDAVTAEPILVLLDESRPYRLETDSSDQATGAVLS
jgi:hypothetical protein